MLQIHSFTFNPFQENTYILYEPKGPCIIIDPGCQSRQEQQQLKDFITAEGLTPVRLVNTHCHIDHVFGNAFVHQTYQLPLEAHRGEIPVLEAAIPSSLMYGVPLEPSPPIERFLDETMKLTFGDHSLEILFTPGHSPASLSFYHQPTQILIAGDVLFHESIGRTDLPGGDFQTLANSITEQLYSLNDQVRVYPGHGPSTTIGHEKRHNPFVRGLI